jgi:hypothetical protein
MERRVLSQSLDPSTSSTLEMIDKRMVYMLLELERIKEMRILHLYVFPMGFFEFRCVIFRKQGCIRFKIIKKRIGDKWDVQMHDTVECSQLKELKGDLDAYVVLLEIIRIIDEDKNLVVIRNGGDMYPFRSNVDIDKKKGITDMIKFINSRCKLKRCIQEP